MCLQYFTWEQGTLYTKFVLCKFKPLHIIQVFTYLTLIIIPILLLGKWILGKGRKMFLKGTFDKVTGPMGTQAQANVCIHR